MKKKEKGTNRINPDKIKLKDLTKTAKIAGLNKFGQTIETVHCKPDETEAAVLRMFARTKAVFQIVSNPHTAKAKTHKREAEHITEKNM
jgi:hypothetical protein